MKISGSAAVMQCLVEEGVDTIFGYPGGAIMPTYDALYDYKDKIRHILVRHEQGASHAAEGYARVTGNAGVCLVTSGPGATNLVTGIADAMLDSVPMVCITGQVKDTLLGTDAFQEIDIISITIPITKWNYQITSAEEIPEVMAKAFYIAQSGRPGPVLIDITKNAQVEEFEFNYKKIENLNTYKPKPEFKTENLEKTVELINNAKRPLILAGHGVLISKATGELQQFAERTGIPVSCTLHGLSCFPSGHELYAGMLGMHGNYGPNVLSNKADLIIAIGMRFDDRVTGDLSDYLHKAKIIHVEIDPAEINKIVKATVSFNADAKDFLNATLPLVESNQHSEWLEEFKKCDAIEFEKVIKNELHPESGKLKMAEVVRIVSEQTNGEAIVVADVGQHQMIAARYYKFKKPDSFITSGGLGTMGFALPAAIGARVASKDRPVVTFIGDGCIQMTIQELATIAQEKTPVKIIVLNNNFLGMVRQWQQMFFDKRYSFVNLENPDFVKVSEGFGVPAEKVEERGDLESAISRMLNTEGPYLLEIVVEKEDNVFPMVPAGASVSDIRLD